MVMVKSAESLQPNPLAVVRNRVGWLDAATTNDRHSRIPSVASEQTDATAF